MTLSPGALIGHYRVLSLLGRGGMGEVYEAEDQTLHRRVALKLLTPPLAVDPAALERFRREARAAATITDPQVVTVHSIEESDGIHFLTMELVEGVPLQAEVRPGGLPLPRALGLMIGICDGVASAHDKGVVHRDLKPGNIMVTAGDRVKVLDFGLARLREAFGSSESVVDGHAATVAALTKAHQILGTTAYMSPEQAAGGSVDHRSDIFSLGTILYELVAGERPFKGDTALAVLTAIARDTPRPLTEVRRALPPDVWRIARRALAKEPIERYQSARDMGHDLRDLRQQLSDGDAEGAAALVSTRPRRWRTALPWTVVAGLAAMLAVAWMRPAPATTTGGSALRVSLTPPPETVLPVSVGTLGAALSPDGRHVAYGAVGPDGRASLWVRSLDSTESRRVTDSQNATGWLFWSPDSKSLGYGADGKLRALDIDTGRSRVIGDAPGFRGAAWGRDGSILFAPTETGGLVRMAASGGAVTPVTTLDAERGETSHRMPSFLPDGVHFLYRVQAKTDDVAGIYVGALNDPARRRLVAADSQGAYAPEGFLFFMVGGTLFAQRFDPVAIALASSPVPLATRVATQRDRHRRVLGLIDRYRRLSARTAGSCHQLSAVVRAQWPSPRDAATPRRFLWRTRSVEKRKTRTAAARRGWDERYLGHRQRRRPSSARHVRSRTGRGTDVVAG
ncbi:MAG: protein kinase [Vicinamibacterales bacterium]